MTRRSTAAFVVALVLAAGLAWLPAGPTAHAQGCDPLRPDSGGTVDFRMDDAALQLDPGGTGSVNGTVELSIRPYPVDVFFVLDASTSMEPLLTSLADTIDEAAASAVSDNIDLRAGVAWYAEFGPETMYVLNRRLQYVDCTFRSAFPQGEDNAAVEPQLFALHEAVVGSGLSEGQIQIPPGQNARFRTPGLKLVMHASNEDFSKDVPYSPSYDEVVAAYRAREVIHTGILVIDSSDPASLGPNSPTDPVAARADLARLSRDTGGVAPGPVDCNGDGVPDLAPGDPVVCTFDAGLGAQLISAGDIVAALVEALRPPSELVVRPTATDGLAVQMSGATATVDLAVNAHRMTPRADITCPSDSQGSSHAAEFGVFIDGVAVASQTVQVTCGDAPPGAPSPAAAPPPPPPGQPAPPPPASPQPPPPPLQTTITVSAPNAASATATQTLPATASQLAPGAMVVPDEAREPELAYDTDVAIGDDQLLASRRRPAPAPVVTWIAGALLLTAMSIAAQRRQQDVPAYARRR